MNDIIKISLQLYAQSIAIVNHRKCFNQSNHILSNKSEVVFDVPITKLYAISSIFSINSISDIA
jgi:hypothetical protein